MAEQPNFLGRSSIEAYIGIAVSVIQALIPMTWQLRILLLLIVAALIVDFVRRSPWSAHWPRAAKTAASVVGIGALVWGSAGPIREQYLAGEKPPNPLIIMPLPPEKPNVNLQLVSPPAPAIFLLNTSDQIAKDIQYWGALWDLELVDRQDSLFFRAYPFAFIRPHEGGGPVSFMDDSAIAIIKKGDRIFGMLAVTCPDCIRTKTYLAYIVWGEGGWYWEAPAGHEINASSLAKSLPDMRKDMDRFLSAAAPVGERHQIMPLQ